MGDLTCLFVDSKIVDLVCAELFHGKDPPVVIAGLPHIGKAARGKRALDGADHQGQSWWHEVRRWEDPVDATSLPQRSETAFVDIRLKF